MIYIVYDKTDHTYLSFKREARFNLVRINYSQALSLLYFLIYSNHTEFLQENIMRYNLVVELNLIISLYYPHASLSDTAHVYSAL